jgi:uncharacterized protein
MKIGPIVLLMVLVLAGCENSQTSSAPPSDAPPPAAPQVLRPDPSIPTAAQPRLPELRLYVGAEELVAELAMTPRQIQTGMMFRTEMAENEAMLFVFGAPYQAAFWMKNTLLPLSAAYINPEGIILEIHDLQPHDTNSVVAATDQVQYVLETNQGWFRKKNIHPGMVIRTEHGTLQETFFRNRMR